MIVTGSAVSIFHGTGQGGPTYVFIGKFMAQSNPLRLMLDRATIHDGMLE